MTDPVSGVWKLEVVPHGYPYLPVKPEDEKLVSPSNVNRLRDGRFCARYATVFDHEGQKFTIIIAVDGKRRTLDGYKQLGRQRQAGCGIPLSSQRGVFLTSHGVRVIGANIEDSYNYVAQVKEILKVVETPVGFTLGDIRLKSGMNAIGNVIRVLSLRRLLETTFKLKHRAATTTKA